MHDPSVGRRAFLERGATAALYLPAGPSLLQFLAQQGVTTPPRDALEAEQGPRGGVVLQADEGELLISGRRRAPMRIKVDSVKLPGVNMSMVISEVAAGAAIPVHRHRNEDELIFVHTGKGVVTLGDRRVPVSSGAMLYGPRGVWHGIENDGAEMLTWCAIFSPAGFEQYFREVGVPPGSGRQPPPAEQVNALAARYGLEFRDG